MRLICLLTPGLFVLMAAFAAVSCHGADTWWPTQKTPRALVRTIGHEHFEKATSLDGKETAGHLGVMHLMVESVAGLAAQAVNEGRCDELVWITVDHPTLPENPDYARWYRQVTRRLDLTDRGQLSSWDIVKRFVGNGVIKGYILYRYDYSSGGPYAKRADVDHSANVATSLAGILGGVLIEEGQEAQAIALGLKKLADARDKDAAWCLNTYQDRFNRDMVLLVDPKAGHCRDLAIAHRCLAVVDYEESAPQILEWLNPLAIILGWTCGDEGHAVRLTSRYGHLQSATNWSLNIPVLSAGRGDFPTRQVRTGQPWTIDFNTPAHASSFVLSDGDNVCWTMGDFTHNEWYWGSPLREKLPFGWTSCLANISQASPDTLEYMLRTQAANDTLIEFAGGYHYPDLFGSERNNAEELVAAHARRVWRRMQRFGVNIFGFICMDLDSPAARRAYEIYAREMPGLLGMIAIQYYPYEGGAGKIYWVKNPDGIDIPVVTAKHTIWANYHLDTGGTPARVARLINEAAVQADQNETSSYNWTIVHAWSGFKRASGADETAENGRFGSKDAHVALAPTRWCIKRLDKSIKVVTPEELLWRIRMDHKPDQTRAVIAALQKRTAIVAADCSPGQSARE